MARTSFDKELHELDAQMVGLGSLADIALAKALEAFETGDQDKAGTVIVSDTLIDDLHLAIEQNTFRAMALQQPLARHDLRYLTAFVPITIDLERIGDEAEAIAQNVLRMIPFRSKGSDNQSAEASLSREILDLGHKIRLLLQATLKAFVERDVEAARRLWEQDKLVDRRFYEIRHKLMSMLEGTNAMQALKQDPHILQRATYMLWITHELERVADHCTNICERIVFIALGESGMHFSLQH